MDLLLFPNHAINKTRNLVFCVPEGDYVLAVTDVGRDGFEQGYIELYANANFVHRVDGNFGSTECLKFNANGAVAEMRNSEETIGAEFGDLFHYESQSQVVTVSCAASNEPCYTEPVAVAKGYVMKVDVALENATVGVCVNNVTRVEVGVEGDEFLTVFPTDDGVPGLFSSRLLSCRGHSKIMPWLLDGMLV